MLISDGINHGKLQSIIVGELKKVGLKHRLKKIILKNVKVSFVKIVANFYYFDFIVFISNDCLLLKGSQNSVWSPSSKSPFVQCSMLWKHLEYSNSCD